MTNAVRPASRRRSPRSMRRSVPMSTDDVASSRMRMRGSARSARCERDELPLPERELEPALTDVGVVAGGQLLHESVGADGLRPRPRSRRASLRVGERDVGGDRAGEQKALLRDDAELPSQRPCVTSRRS